MSRLSGSASGGFSPLTMIVVLLVGVVSLAGLGLLSAYQPELKSGNDGRGHALSRSSIGYAALPRLLRDTGAPVVLSRGPMGENGADSLLVLTPNPSPDMGKGRVDGVQHDGPTLIVLPKWNAAPYPKRAGWVTTAGVLPLDMVLGALPQDLRKDTTLTQRGGVSNLALRRPSGAAFGAPVEIDSLRTISGPQWIPVVIDAQGAPVLVFNAKQRLYVLSDPDLVNTQGLKTLNGAKTGLAIMDVVRPAGAPIAFDLTLHGFQRTRSLLRLMIEPPLLGLTLVMAALAAFAGWQSLIRFGPALQSGRVVALGKRALADNTAALVRMAKREHHMASPYALLVRGAVARAIGAPRSLDGAELDAFLDRVGVTVGAARPYTVLAAEARTAQTPGDLMRVARDLYRWTQEMTRARQ